MQFTNIVRIALCCGLLSACSQAPQKQAPQKQARAYDAGHENPTRAEKDDQSKACRDVAACAAIAAQDPEHFSQTLWVSLGCLSTPELANGLSWTYERPEVTKRARKVTEDLLRSRRDHSSASAQRLLQHALDQGDYEQKRWISVLAQDTEGRAALGEYLDRLPASAATREVMMEYVSAAPYGEGGSFSYRDENKKVPAADRARIQKYSDVFWGAYLSIRPTVSARRTSRGDRLCSASVSAPLLRHIHSCGVYQKRLAAIVTKEVQEGGTPLWPEVSALGLAAQSRSEFKAMFQSWLSSERRVLRLLAVFYAVLDSDVTPRDSEEWRGFLKTFALPDDSIGLFGRDIVALTKHLIPKLTLRDAAELIAVAASAERDIERIELLVHVAGQHPEYRQTLLRALLSGPLDDARLVSEKLPPNQFPEIREGIIRWILSLKAEQLRNEDVQSRLRIVTFRLERSLGDRLPRVLRERDDGGGCGYGMDRLAGAARSREDLEAFGLPVPERLRGARVGHSVADPPSDGERAARVREFEVALNAVQDELRAKAKQ